MESNSRSLENKEELLIHRAVCDEWLHRNPEVFLALVDSSNRCRLSVCSSSSLISLPGISGWELAEAIYNLNVTSDTSYAAAAKSSQ